MRRVRIRRVEYLNGSGGFGVVACEVGGDRF
jgi:hypothetical protein